MLPSVHAPTTTKRIQSDTEARARNSSGATRGCDPRTAARSCTTPPCKTIRPTANHRPPFLRLYLLAIYSPQQALLLLPESDSPNECICIMYHIPTRWVGWWPAAVARQAFSDRKKNAHARKTPSPAEARAFRDGDAPKISYTRPQVWR